MDATLFADRTQTPDTPALESALGTAAGLWRDLDGELIAAGAAARWTWGGRSGWQLDYRRAGRPLLTVYPKPGAFTALIVLGRDASAAADEAPISARTRDALERTAPLHDGRWLFLTVDDETSALDAWTLVACKLPPTVRARLSRSAPVGASGR